MSTFGAIHPNNYVVEDFYTSAILKWKLISGSNGIVAYEVEDLPELDDELINAISITRATNDLTYFNKNRNVISGLPESLTNIETGIQEHLLYKSIHQTFYKNKFNFISASIIVTSSITGLQDNSYVVSIGQDFYGERVKPGTFKLGISSSTLNILDDADGNLYVSQSGIGTYVGNIFYNYGIAVIPHNTASLVSYIGPAGIKIISGSEIRVDYGTDVKINRHQINILLRPTDFNFSMFNPSIHKSTLQTTSSLTQSLNDLNIPQSGSNTWKYSSLMRSGLVKPYITTIGLYNAQYELVAVAKLSTPIQRTFDTDQIFIVRFDT